MSSSYEGLDHRKIGSLFPFEMNSGSEVGFGVGRGIYNARLLIIDVCMGVEIRVTNHLQ